MTKEKFYELIHSELQTHPLEEQIEIIHNMKHKWLEAYENSLLIGKKYCYRCCKYYNKEDFEKVEREEIREEPDSGGYLKVRARVQYLKCPNCGSLYRESMHILEILHD